VRKASFLALRERNARFRFGNRARSASFIYVMLERQAQRTRLNVCHEVFHECVTPSQKVRLKKSVTIKNDTRVQVLLEVTPYVPSDVCES